MTALALDTSASARIHTNACQCARGNAMSTLITFLGKGQQGAGGYRKVRYSFADDCEKETAFFGLAAAEFSQANTVRILGTSGSMWDVLTLEHGNTSGHETQWDELAAAVSSDSVNQDQLSAIESILNRQGKRIL